ncbi:MAG TPA: sugar ABC transporter ATP-binding protein [Methylomirabilota bacterium]|nr:sugar ABC transporter ATP-binding protein [Methylomirabilota bacterium]
MLEDITKTYPGVVALDGVSLSVSPGEVIGLVGENGAGKSTLMKILGGVVEPTAGTIRLDGAVRRSLTVNDAIRSGIAFVHQELNLFDNLDVAANVFIGREPLRGGRLRLVDRRRMVAEVQPILDMLGVDFKPDTPVATMAIAQRQLLEIAKALSQNARLVIMDEPTSSLTLSETARLLQVVAKMKADGVSVIFISHRLGELSECADRVVVLRDGRVVGKLQKHEISHGAMIRLMIGRELKALYTPPAEPAGEPVLKIVDARTSTYPGQTVNLSLRRGEILGLAGLVGSGRTELARAIFGIDPLLSGQIRVEGRDGAPRSPREAIERGIYLVPEDRKRSGLLLDLSIAENIALPSLTALSRLGIVLPASVQESGARQKSRLGIKAVSLASLAGALSGGNQQKVVLAKWLSLDPKVLICDEPTRGIDVGAKQDIYAMLRKLADAGVAILMISSDMEEVIGVSDRIAVMREGRISGTLDRSQFSEHNVLLLAVGEPLQ